MSGGATWPDDVRVSAITIDELRRRIDRLFLVIDKGEASSWWELHMAGVPVFGSPDETRVGCEKQRLYNTVLAALVAP